LTFIVHSFRYGFKNLIGVKFEGVLFVSNGCVPESLTYLMNVGSAIIYDVKLYTYIS